MYSSSLLAKLRMNSSDNNKFKLLARRKEIKCKTVTLELLVVAEVEEAVLRPIIILICKLVVL
jgi:hypothetical protein